MKITNRLFTYPVLRDTQYDYKNATFSAKCNYAQRVNAIDISVDISLNCKEVETLISTGKAQYVVHMECPSTAFRAVRSSISSHIEISVPLSKINGSFDAVTFVVLRENVTGFTCDDWVDDFAGMSFDLQVGTILAYQNLPGIKLSKNRLDFSNAGSIFTIYSRAGEGNQPAEVSLESSQIRIGLGADDFKVYSLYASKTELQPIFNAMFIFPALVYMFEELSMDDGEAMYETKPWFVALEKAYKSRGVDLMNEIRHREKSAYQLAQEAMELPFEKALGQMPMLLKDTEEDDDQ